MPLALRLPRLRETIALLCVLVLASAVHAQTGDGFIENRGQWPDEVRYLARLPGQNVWVTDDALVYDFHEVEASAPASDGPPFRDHDGLEETERRVRGHVVALRFEGGAVSTVRPERARSTRLHYFLGNDPARHASHVRVYEAVTLEGVWEGVDLRLGLASGGLVLTLESGDAGRLSAVRLTVVGGTAPAEAGDEAGAALMVATRLGSRPAGVVRGAVRDGEGRRWYAGTLGAGGVQVDLDRPAGAPEAEPPASAHSGGSSALEYSTFLGGMTDDLGRAVAVDADGRATLAGETLSWNFPTTPGAYDTSHNGGFDAFVARLSADGSALEYSTFLGGTGGDGASEVAVGADGSATVAGYTHSSDFPATPGAYDTTYNGDYDAFVVRLSADGSALEYATFLGGTNFDRPYGVAVDADGRATITGRTDSTDFPTTPGAYDTSFNGGRDTFVVRLDLGEPVSVEPGPDAPLPATATLLPPYPNPAAQTATGQTVTVPFALPDRARVVIRVHDLLGREVRVLLDAEVAAGAHAVRLDVQGLAGGVYLVRMEAGDLQATRSLTVFP